MLGKLKRSQRQSGFSTFFHNNGNILSCSDQTLAKSTEVNRDNYAKEKINDKENEQLVITEL